MQRYLFAAQFVTGRTVVDCASGDGTGSRILGGSGAALVLGFDISGDAVAEARRTATGPNIAIEVGDAHSLPLPDQCIDVYVSFETIEHLEQPLAFLADVTRVLRTDGTFVCSTPNRDVYSPGHNAGSRPWNPFHIHEFSTSEIAEELMSRFETVTLYGQNPRHRARVRCNSAMGRVLPWNLTIRLRQVAKLPLLAVDSADRHRVRPLDGGRPSEYVLAVCTNARR